MHLKINDMILFLIAQAARDVDFVQKEHWCCISYYEFMDRVGEIYNSSKNPTWIDGFCNPTSPDRYGLGSLINTKRIHNPQIEAAKELIGNIFVSSFFVFIVLHLASFLTTSYVGVYDVHLYSSVFCQ